nr:MAG TPA: hypothetical protein [Caudoviricetes sp.]
MLLQLTKQSTDSEIKAYFEEVLRLARDSKEFPVNLDDVWPLVFGRKQEAVRALKNDRLFVEGIDFQPLRNDAQRSENGQFNGCDKVTYMLSVPCLEFFIARKVRPVFEVYRQVFHKVASGELPLRMPNYISGNTEGTLAPLAHFHANIMERYARVVNDSKGLKEITGLMEDCEEYYTLYRLKVANLPYIEAVRNLEGKESLQDRPLYSSIPEKVVAG